MEFFEVLQTLVILQAKIHGLRNDPNHTFKFAVKHMYLLYLAKTLKLFQKLTQGR